jgi:hypothetical protein
MVETAGIEIVRRLNFLSFDWHRAPQRTKSPIVCPVLGWGLAASRTISVDGSTVRKIFSKGVAQFPSLKASFDSQHFLIRLPIATPAFWTF